ncbi:DoxX family protein [Candidatus Woesearchaeota archaeon]|nr:DoxX family protein [Candidatus Woesearchaeota archaeon]
MVKKDKSGMKLCSISPDCGILLLRILVGVMFIFSFGYGKFFGGPTRWAAVAGMAGITFLPVFWGFLVAVIEFIGGIMVLIGLYTRFAALAIALVLLVALFTAHREALFSLNVAGFGTAFTFFMVALALFKLGGGNHLNLEKKLFKKEA